MTGADVRVGNYRYLLNQQTLIQDASKNLEGAVSVYLDWVIFTVERDKE